MNSTMATEPPRPPAGPAAGPSGKTGENLPGPQTGRSTTLPEISPRPADRPPPAHEPPTPRSITSSYSGAAANALSQITGLSDSALLNPVSVSYQYLGLGTPVIVQTALTDTLVSPTGSVDPDTGDIYSGLDRFGRVKTAAGGWRLDRRSPTWPASSTATTAPAARIFRPSTADTAQTEIANPPPTPATHRGVAIGVSQKVQYSSHTSPNS
jgi:hypothetical protein